MTAMASDDLRDDPPQTSGGRDASYETYLRVKNGVSDAALRAAGLPPAQSLTYEEYLATVAGKGERKDEALERLRGTPTMRLEPAADRVPGPPPLGRRLVLDEAPDGSWRIAADPHQRPRWGASPPPHRRVFAKIVGMSMGIAMAFVAAAYINAVYLPDWRSPVAGARSTGAGAPPAPVRTQAGAEPKGMDPVAITVTDPGTALGLDTASGDESHILPDTSWAAPSPQPQRASESDGGPSKAAAPAKTSPQKIKPVDLPSSTPAATQQRLPNSTQTTQGAPSYTKPASAP